MLIIVLLFANSCSAPKKSQAKLDAEFEQLLNQQIESRRGSTPKIREVFDKYIGKSEAKKLGNGICKSIKNSTFQKDIKAHWDKMSDLKREKKLSERVMNDINASHVYIRTAAVNSYCPEYKVQIYKELAKTGEE